MLEKLQYSAIRLALGFRSIPTNIFFAESKLTFLKERAKLLYNSFLAKIASNKSLIYTDVIKSYCGAIKSKNNNFRCNGLLLSSVVPFFHSYDMISSNVHYNIYYGR